MEEVKIVPTYYAVIPAEIRYDEKLTANEKLLYGEIAALSNSHGQCHARNTYFAELYKVDKKTVSRWVGSLASIGYVTRHFEENTSTGEKQRFLSITPQHLIPIQVKEEKKAKKRRTRNVPSTKPKIPNVVVKKKKQTPIQLFQEPTEEEVVVDEEDKPYLDYVRTYNEAICKDKPHVLNSKQVTSKYTLSCVKTVKLVVTLDKISLNELKSILSWARKHSFWGQHVNRLTQLRNKNEKGNKKIGNIKEQWLATQHDSPEGGHVGFTTGCDITQVYLTEVGEYGEAEAYNRRERRYTLKAEGKPYEKLDS